MRIGSERQGKEEVGCLFPAFQTRLLFFFGGSFGRRLAFGFDAFCFAFLWCWAGTGAWLGAVDLFSSLGRGLCTL
jgi:hypothetical protein